MALVRLTAEEMVQKAQLSEPIGNSTFEVSQARYGWVRVVKAMLANVELAQISDEQDRILFAALRSAELTADRRKRGRARTTNATTAGPQGGT